MLLDEKKKRKEHDKESKFLVIWRARNAISWYTFTSCRMKNRANEQLVPHLELPFWQLYLKF